MPQETKTKILTDDPSADIHLLNLAQKIEAGKKLNSFMLNAITSVPKRQHPYFVEFNNAVRMLLQFRYGVNFSSALNDNESTLDSYPQEQQARMCYIRDQASVEWSDFIIGDVTFPSTGLGQEVERANSKGIPIIALVRGTRRIKPEERPYLVQPVGGEIEHHALHVGSGGVSFMLQGNPALKVILKYPALTLRRIINQRRENLGWRLEYGEFDSELVSKFIQPNAPEWLAKGLKALGRLVRRGLEESNARSYALRELDRILQEVFHLVPKTVELEKKLVRLKSLPAQNGEQKYVDEELARTEKKIQMLDATLYYQPRRVHHEYQNYKTAFPELARRVSQHEAAKGMSQSHTDRLITPRFYKLSANGDGRTNGNGPAQTNRNGQAKGKLLANGRP